MVASCCAISPLSPLDPPPHHHPGWFTEPAPFFDGPLPEAAASRTLSRAMTPLLLELEQLPRVRGMLTLRLEVSGADGTVSNLELLADTLVALPAAAADFGLGSGLLEAATVRGAVQHSIVQRLGAVRFPACADGDTRITLPLLFD